MKNRTSFILSCLSLVLVCLGFWLASFKVDYSVGQRFGVAFICIIWAICVFIYNAKEQ